MKTIPVQESRTKLLTLTSSHEKILRAIHFYRFMSAQDLCRLLYSPRSLSHVREILSNLVNSKYLFRFELPHTSRGNTEKIYTLSGSKGRDFLASELGLPVDWYFRPYKVKHLSYSQVLHNLVLTRFIVSVAARCAKEPNFRLSQTRICYELARTPVTVEVAREGKIEKLKVIPDAWIEFECNNGMKFPVLLEIDRGMEYGKKFMHHVRSRIEFIKSGAYRKMFGTDAVMIVYLTTGEMPEYRETRRKAMCVWTQEVLADLHMENWSHIYRFASVVFEDLYTTPLFDEPVWYRPDSPTPVSLFTF